MGTLSGGGTVRVSIGARTLLGAISGLGIALGDDCILEAGVYITAGSKVVLADGPGARAPGIGRYVAVGVIAIVVGWLLSSLLRVFA